MAEIYNLIYQYIEKTITQLSNTIENILINSGLSNETAKLVLRVFINGALFALTLLVVYFVVRKVVKTEEITEAVISPEITTEVAKPSEGIDFERLSLNGLKLMLNVSNFALNELEKYSDKLSDDEYEIIKDFYETRASELNKRIEELKAKEELETLKKEAEVIPTISPPSGKTETGIAAVSELAESPIIEEMLKKINTIVQEFKKEEE
ncbi:MAG: hypothetical protein ACP6IS_05240 [Candidatus Asgardarchaeia archaeon]